MDCSWIKDMVTIFERWPQASVHTLWYLLACFLAPACFIHACFCLATAFRHTHLAGWIGP